jgi:hypothetical protein
MGIHILRLLKKIQIFLEQKWLFARAPKGVLEKNERGLKTTFPLTFGKNKPTFISETFHFLPVYTFLFFYFFRGEGPSRDR